MKAVKITNTKTGRKSTYSGFKSDSHAENYSKTLVLPEECSLEVIDIPENEVEQRVTIIPEKTEAAEQWEREIEMTDRAMETLDTFFDRMDNAALDKYLEAPEIDFDTITVTGDVVTIPLKGWGEKITYNDLTKETLLMPSYHENHTM